MVLLRTSFSCNGMHLSSQLISNLQRCPNLKVDTEWEFDRHYGSMAMNQGCGKKC